MHFAVAATATSVTTAIAATATAAITATVTAATTATAATAATAPTIPTVAVNATSAPPPREAVRHERRLRTKDATGGLKVCGAGRIVIQIGDGWIAGCSELDVLACAEERRRRAPEIGGGGGGVGSGEAMMAWRVGLGMMERCTPTFKTNFTENGEKGGRKCQKR